MSTPYGAFLNLNSAQSELHASLLSGFKVVCRSPCQLLEVRNDCWIVEAKGEVALLLGDSTAYICFIGLLQTYAVKVMNGMEWSRLHTNLLVVNNIRLMAFNFAIGFERNCDRIESFLLHDCGAKIVVKKFVHQLHSVETILRDGAHKVCNYIGISAVTHSRTNIMHIDLPYSVSHKATVRLENGWMTAKYTDDADPSTVYVIAASGVEPHKVLARSLD